MGNDYWEKRSIEREQHWYDKATAELNEKVSRYFYESLEKIQRDIESLYQRYADENGLSMLEARRLIRGKEFKKWRMTLEEYVKTAKFDSEILRELNTLAMRSRVNRLEKLMAETLIEVDKLCEKTDDFLTSFLSRAYYDNYYKSLFDLHKGAGLNTPPVKVDTSQVEKVIRTAWSGANYSTRIWRNGTKLAKEIESTVTSAVHRGISTQKLSRDLARRMEVSYNNAERLVRTELNFVQNQAALDSLKSAELEHYRFVAALDHRTCPRCGGIDGQVFEVQESMPGENFPPIHPRCRCTVVPSLGYEYASKRRAGREKVPAEMTYSEWRAEYVEKVSQSKMSETKKPIWATRGNSKILSKEDCGKLRELAEHHKIYLSGVKNFDGKFETVKEVIETMASLQAQFPNVASGGKRLTLTMNPYLDAEDFAVTTKMRNINLNANAYRNINLLQKEYQKAVDDGWFVKGTNYKSIVHHEFGHIVANVYKIDSLKTACEITGKSAKETLYWLKKNLSVYAGSFSNGDEIISEVFADVSTGKPSDFSKKFYDKVFELARR